MLKRINFGRIRNYDAFAKVTDDLRTRTIMGGITTLASMLTVLYLISAEIGEFRTPVWTSEIALDTTREQKMHLYLNVTFLESMCFYLTSDILDAGGCQQLGITGSTKKTRVDVYGNEILTVDVPSNNSMATMLKDPTYCGSCYEFATYDDGQIRCCNTCDDVKQLYRQNGREILDYNQFEQCNSDNWAALLQNKQHEGCNIAGVYEINKIPGNFHTAPGYCIRTKENIHVHDLTSFKDHKFNTSHIIHHLSFGKSHPSIPMPLNGLVQISERLDQIYTYFISVVPTRIIDRFGHVTNTNQFTVTYTQHDMKNSLTGLPGFFLNLEISPTMAIYRETRPPLSRTIVNIFSIIGGTYAIFSALDSAIYAAEKKLLHKYIIGKAL